MLSIKASRTPSYRLQLLPASVRSALLSVSQRNFQTFRDTLDLTWFQKKLGYEFS